MSDSTSSSHSSHHVQHFSPHSPSSSPPAQLSSREKLVSSNAEDHTAPKHQTIIRPQDVNTQLTSGLAALVQETLPLAPYKIQHSAKTDGSPNAQARALLQLHDTPIAADLPSPAEILHGWPAQGAVMPRCHRPINIPRICRCLLEIQNTQKEHFNRAHRAKDK